MKECKEKARKAADACYYSAAVLKSIERSDGEVDMEALFEDCKLKYFQGVDRCKEEHGS